MQIAFFLGQGLEREKLTLPRELADVKVRAQFIEQRDRPLLVDGQGVPQWVGMGTHLRDIAVNSADAMPDVGDPLDRVSITLRLWAGCLEAAKAIAYKTRSGPNSEVSRAEAFKRIDEISAMDELFRAGEEAAPAFKAIRSDPYCFDGVPSNSAVRKQAG